MRLMAALLATLCVATTTSCLLGDDDDGDGTSYVAVTEIADEYKDAICAYYANCGVFPDKDTCLAANLTASGQSFGVDANTVAAIYAGLVRYNGSNVKECLDAIAQRSCDKTSESARVTPLACRDVLSGTKASGESCLVDEECMSLQCSGESSQDACQPGICVGDVRPMFTIKMVGEPCNSIEVCENGAYCDQLTDMCTLLKAQGESCTQNSECAYGLGCTGTTGARICDPLPGPGETCYTTTVVECRDEGTVCDTATTLCTQVGGPGMTCDSSSDCSMYYPCNFTSLQCTRGPALGEACSSSARCFDVGTFCDTADTGTCVELRSNGMACQQDTECVSGSCDLTMTTPLCAEVTTCDF
jgi:hypothetical protein